MFKILTSKVRIKHSHKPNLRSLPDSSQVHRRSDLRSSGQQRSGQRTASRRSGKPSPRWQTIFTIKKPFLILGDFCCCLFNQSLYEFEYCDQSNKTAHHHRVVHWLFDSRVVIYDCRILISTLHSCYSNLWINEAGRNIWTLNKLYTKPLQNIKDFKYG